jgi:rhodanese-related sulfurtransferase
MDITVEELKNRLEAGEELNLIDVREEHEYEADNLGAYLIPLGDLPGRLSELEELKEQEVIVHCRSGARSDKAKQFLAGNGFSNVRNVLGGILAYRELEENEE